MKAKLASRKFWVAVAAALASMGTSVAGIAGGSEPVAVAGAVCTMLSAAIYAACEAYVDGRAATQTVVTTSASTEAKVSATANGANAAPVIDSVVGAKAGD